MTKKYITRWGSAAVLILILVIPLLLPTLILFYLLYVIVAGIITQVERKLLAIFQNRLGPTIVGTRGILQFAADALKVLLKEVIYLNRTNKMWLTLMPLSFFIINLALTSTLTWGNNLSFINLEYDLAAIAMVMALSNLLIVYTGFIIKNKYTQLSSNRAAFLGVNIDILLGFFLSIFIMIAGSLSLDDLNAYKLTTTLAPGLFMLAPPIIGLMLMESGKAPFDLIEAETEVIMGFFIEYSGFLFIIFLLGEYLHMYYMAYIVGMLYL